MRSGAERALLVKVVYGPDGEEKSREDEDGSEGMPVGRGTHGFNPEGV